MPGLQISRRRCRIRLWSVGPSNSVLEVKLRASCEPVRVPRLMAAGTMPSRMNFARNCHSPRFVPLSGCVRRQGLWAKVQGRSYLQTACDSTGPPSGWHGVDPNPGRAETAIPFQSLFWPPCADEGMEEPHERSKAYKKLSRPQILCSTAESTIDLESYGWAWGGSRRQFLSPHVVF